MSTHNETNRVATRRRRIVFFTGAGMSRESGLPTFRGEGGLWDSLNVEEVASRRAWYCGRRSDCDTRRAKVLDFVNNIRRQILEHEPNEGHRIIAEMERSNDIVVITQNGDDYHERAGTSRVIHLHGEALKNASTLHPHETYDIDRHNPDIHIGDKAADGSQLRPYVVLFGEDIESHLWSRAIEATKNAEIFVVVGSTMLVHPAADIIRHTPQGCDIYIIDPEEVRLPKGWHRKFTHIALGASKGLEELTTILKH